MGLPCGTFNESYDQAMAVVRTKMQWVLLISGILVCLAVPLFANNYLLSILIIMMVYIISSMGMNLLTGFCGQVSLAHAAFMGVGAYTSAILSAKLGLPFWVALPCAGIMAGLVGVVFGGPSLRLKGLYLVMSTLAAQYIITFVIVRWKSVTGGAIGYNAAVPNLFGIAFDTNQKFFYIAFVVMIIMTFIAKNLVRTQVGRAWVAIRDNEIAAEAQGINLAKYKITAFFIGCFFAGIAGSLWAHWLRVVSIDQFNILQSINYLVYVIIGGIATMIGPFIGVVFMTLLSEGLGLILGAASDVFPAVSSYIFASREVLFGIVIVIFLIFQPRGLAYRWSWLKTYFRTWPFGH